MYFELGIQNLWAIKAFLTQNTKTKTRKVITMPLHLFFNKKK